MINFKIKVGIVPNVRDVANFETRKGIFEPAKGVENKDKCISYIRENFEDENTVFTDLDWLNKLGVVYKNKDCDAVCDYLKKQEVDALFIMNCNFGNEEVCGQIAKKMNIPVLLWGPQDMVFEENGQRYTDAQCGLFAISKQLRRYNIPFSYIENCKVEDSAFREGIKKFLSVVTMVKNFKKLNVTLIGTRLNAFKSVMCNELELTEKFGFNMNTINLIQFTDRFEKALSATDYTDEIKKLKEKYDVGTLSDEGLKRTLNFVTVYKNIADEMDSDVLASECWSCMPLGVGAVPCLAMSILSDMGYIVTCESDIHGAITNALLMCATRGEAVPVFGEFTVRHPENENAELLWHCGPFPYSIKDKTVKAKLIDGKPSFKAKDGEYTIARFQADSGKYKLLGGTFTTVPGPHTFGTYMWAEFKNWSKLERKMIEGPYIHHMSEIYGKYDAVLREFCKYVPELEFDPLEE